MNSQNKGNDKTLFVMVVAVIAALVALVVVLGVFAFVVLGDNDSAAPSVADNILAAEQEPEPAITISMAEPEQEQVINRDGMANSIILTNAVWSLIDTDSPQILETILDLRTQMRAFVFEFYFGDEDTNAGTLFTDIWQLHADGSFDTLTSISSNWHISNNILTLDGDTFGGDFELLFFSEPDGMYLEMIGDGFNLYFAGIILQDLTSQEFSDQDYTQALIGLWVHSDTGNPILNFYFEGEFMNLDIIEIIGDEAEVISSSWADIENGQLILSSFFHREVIDFLLDGDTLTLIENGVSNTYISFEAWAETLIIP